MRIKFIYPPRLYGVGRCAYPPMHHHLVPLGLPTLVSYLRKQGFRVDQDDLDIRCFSLSTTHPKRAPALQAFLDKERILRALNTPDDMLENAAERCLRMTRTRGYDVVGFSITDEFNLAEMGSVVLMAKLLKERNDTFVIVGGSCVNSTVNASLLNASPHIDAVVKGEHLVVGNVLAAIEKGLPLQGYGMDEQRINRQSAENLRGVAGRGRLPWQRKSSSLRLINPDCRSHGATELLPLPVFDGLPLDLYRFSAKDLPLKGRRILLLPYAYLFGCQWNCAFCYQSGIGAFALKEPNVIADELDVLSKRYRTTTFFFRNANCNPSIPFTKAVMRELIERDLNLKWTDCANLVALDKETLALLRKAGAFRLIFGLESASNRMLRYVGKPLTLERAERLLKASHDLGIWNEIEIIAGIPHERPEDIHSSERFLRKNREFIDYYYLNMFHLPDPSGMFADPVRYGITNLRKDARGIGYAFDEVGGLTWEASLEQRKRSFDRLLAVRDELYPFTYTGMEDSFLKLVALSLCYDDKEAIRSFLEKNPSIYTSNMLTPGSVKEDSIRDQLPNIYYRLPDHLEERGKVRR